MKLALRYIPTEVWVNVICYPWITRKRLGRIVDKFRNRHFAEILQYCLHERGKRMLDSLTLNKVAIIPRTPLPENIKFFKELKIRHFDTQTLGFLRHISTLFNDVNLRFALFWTNNDLTKLRAIFDHLSPLLHGIHSLRFDHSAIPLVEQYFAIKLPHVKMLTLYFDFGQRDQATIHASINFCMNWLTSEERGPAEPRLLKVNYCCEEKLQQFCKAIKQQFLSAKCPCTFAIGFLYCDIDDEIADFHLENDLGEQLYGKFDEDGDFWIYRHKQVDSARTQLEEWVKGAVQKSYKSSGIELFSFTTIGQMDSDASDDEEDDTEEEEEDYQPSTSKKPKLA